MRSMWTRRTPLFVLALVLVLILLLHFGLGTQDASYSDSIRWNTKVTLPLSWLGKNGGSSDDNLSEDGGARMGPELDTYLLQANGNAREAILTWDNRMVPTTEMKVHVPGWTIFDHLYLLNGTVFIVTNEPHNFPDRALISSSGYPIYNDPDDVAKRMPSDNDIQIISPQKAAEIFGSYASFVDGTSFVVNDPPQFINHYYHWSAELFFGLWRTYSTLDPNISEDGSTKLPAPRRIMMSHVPNDRWRDYAKMNEYVTRGSFPSISLEFQQDWEDRANMARPFLLERVVFADRAAAMHSPNFVLTARYNSELFKLKGSPYWWSTIRNVLIKLSGGNPQARSGNVITYVSRQEWGRRMLLPEHHNKLVKALEGLRDQYGYEVNIVSMDKLTRQEQFQLAGRTTIMMGVHGNGLTSLLWMRPSPRATVIEFFYPGGFAEDYEWTTRALGMTHYGFWDNEYFTSPDLPPIDYPEGFQGNEIPLDGDVVAKLCHERLSISDE